jgi:hypothetical protein
MWPGQFIGFRPDSLFLRRQLDQEHVLPVVLPVPRGLPQRLVEHERRAHFDVAGREQHLAHVIASSCTSRALRQPERLAGRPRMKPEQAELAAELAVIALLRFFDPLQVRLQLACREERGAIDALHRLVARHPSSTRSTCSAA